MIASMCVVLACVHACVRVVCKCMYSNVFFFHAFNLSLQTSKSPVTCV